MDFYNRLNYSLGNEDWAVESQALRVNPGDHVLCVTASGDRALHLLMTDCAEVTSVDMNSLQNFLLELKIAAISFLDYEKYISFLGCTPCSGRIQIYQSLRNHLSTHAQQYWDKNKKMLARGIIYQGMIERLTQITAVCFNLFKKKDIKTLFSFTNIEEQRVFVEKHWNNTRLKRIFTFVLNPKLMKLVLNDPGMIAHVDSHIKPGEYIYQRMLQYLHHHLARKSALIQLILTGKVTPDAYFPYLTYNGYSLIRKNIHKLKYHTANVIEAITEYPTNKIDCFSLSDIASYMPQAAFENLLTAMVNAAKPKARFCMRKLMSRHYIPARISHHFQQDSFLEKKLELEESNFVYRFMVGEIHK